MEKVSGEIELVLEFTTLPTPDTIEVHLEKRNVRSDGEVDFRNVELVDLSVPSSETRS